MGEWKELGACYRSENPEFFPEPHKGRGGAKKAKAICNTCIVQIECLEFALTTNQIHGIWGGATYSQRVKLRKKARASAQEKQEKDPVASSAQT